MKISKAFEFDYGHRVWTQELNQEYSLDNACVCRHLHGHRGHIEVELKGDVQDNGMVTDFKHLNWFKKWVDDNIDHKFIIDESDPLKNMVINNLDYLGTIDHGFFKSVDIRTVKQDTRLLEFYESFIIVDFVPTSENLCKWFHEIVQQKMEKININVSSIIFKETPKSKSVYEK